MEQLNHVNLYERPELVDLTEAIIAPAAVGIVISGSIIIQI